MRCLPDLIAWSGFGVAPVDGIVMNVLVVEIIGDVAIISFGSQIFMRDR